MPTQPVTRLLTACCLAIAASSSALHAQSAAAGAPSSALPTVQLPPELDRVLRDYERAWTAKDVTALAGLFTADGMALPNGSAPARGAEAIASAYAKGAGMPLSLRAIAFSQSQDFAHIVGGFAPEAGKPDFGKFVLVLRRADDGRWRIAADIDNMNAFPQRPAPAGAPAAKP